MTALTGGDDYELLLAAPPERAGELATLASALGLPLTAIGRIEAGSGVRVIDEKGAAIVVPNAGYRHF
jgi:thiamine-monophosphate kinase